MKKLITVLLIYVGLSTVPPQTNAQTVSVSFQLFYDELSPYGLWIHNPTYGYVWVPNAPGFRPYETEGYWVYTDAGWTWVSYYTWGWAPFHYGRWYYDPLYGYVWIPGNEWGPAWVGWRYCSGYYGWVPLGPGITFGVTYTSYNPPAERWIFVRERDFGSRSVTYVDRSTNVTIIKNSKVINNTMANKSRNETYITGPDKIDVQKKSGRTIQPVTISETSKPAAKLDNNKLNMYRPRVENTLSGSKPAPAKVYTANEAKPVIEKRNTEGMNLNEGKKELQPMQKAPVSNDKRQTGDINPNRMDNKRQMQPQKRITPNLYKQNAQQNNVRPVQSRETKPQIKGKQSPQRFTPYSEPRIRKNEIQQNSPNSIRPVQPTREIKQPMQRVQPVNPQPTKPSMNSGGGQRVPVHGPRKH